MVVILNISFPPLWENKNLRKILKFTQGQDVKPRFEALFSKIVAKIITFSYKSNAAKISFHSQQSDIRAFWKSGLISEDFLGFKLLV